MTAPSQTPESAGLEVVAWTGSGSLSRIKGKDFRFQGYIYGTEAEAHPIALVTAASAQAAIDGWVRWADEKLQEAQAETLNALAERDAAEARVDRLASEIEKWKRLKGYADDQIKVERKAYRSLLAAAPASPLPGDGWQDISTAPRQERVMLGHKDFKGWFCLAICNALGEWSYDDRTWGQQDAPDKDATHWMPLPAAPTGDAT